MLVAGGTYKPVYVTAPTTDERKISFSMKNHVAVIGGFSVAGSWEMSGDIGIAGNGDNTYSVFGHNSINLTNAVIYGVTVTGGNANGGGNLNLGGGMYNSSSSPRLINVVFAGNNAIHYGGGMYNDNNPNLGPLIVNTIFAGNTVAMNGGQDIAMNLDTTDGENIRIAGSVLGIGGANLTNGIVGVGNTGVLNLTYHGLANGEVELRG